MLCFPGDPVPPPTKKSQILVKILWIIGYIQFFLLIPKFMVSVMIFLIEILSVIFLYYAATQLNYCNCVIYIFLCIMNGITALGIIGLSIQKNNYVADYDLINLIMIGDLMLTFSLYVVSIYYAFQSYKEFKGIALDIIKATSSDQGYAYKSSYINYEKNIVEERKDVETYEMKKI